MLLDDRRSAPRERRGEMPVVRFGYMTALAYAAAFITNGLFGVLSVQSLCVSTGRQELMP
jgi:hypothetical protein